MNGYLYGDVTVAPLLTGALVEQGTDSPMIRML